MCVCKGGPRSDVARRKTNVQQWFGKVSRGAHGDWQGKNPDLGPYHERVQRQDDNGVSVGYGKGAQGQARESKEEQGCARLRPSHRDFLL